jgi:hypothetical protein
MSALRRFQPVGVEDFLCGNSRHHHARHFRVQPANAAYTNDKVRWAKDMRFEKNPAPHDQPSAAAAPSGQNTKGGDVPLIVHDPEHLIIAMDRRTYEHVFFAASAQNTSGVSPLLLMRIVI